MQVEEENVRNDMEALRETAIHCCGLCAFLPATVVSLELRDAAESLHTRGLYRLWMEVRFERIHIGGIEGLFCAGLQPKEPSKCL